MQEIRCPKCNEIFQVDETCYASISKQVRDAEFFKEIDEKIQSLKREQDATKTLELSQLENNKNKIISDLQQKLDNYNLKKELEIKNALSEKDSEISNQKSEINSLTHQIENKENEFKISEQNLRSYYEAIIKSKDEEIKYYTDFKAKQTTKMIGESLEQHCEVEFNKLRATGFRNAYFEKDNDARTGSKGDFIFRDFDDNGTEIISIMFEMKNECDETATKHKNESFFKELDKDRREKNCEYAVLVSLLESDSELYNTGIVDVSHKYEKMYVIRPQFFIPIITMLRNSAMNSLEYKQQLAIIQNQNIDITNFENNVIEIKNRFLKQYEWASSNFSDAKNKIRATIKTLEGIIELLEKSEKQLGTANNHLDDLNIRKLTRNNETMRKKFLELESQM